MSSPHVLRSVWVVAAALICALVTGAAEAKDEVHKTYKGFAPSGKYVVMKGKDVVKDAELFHSKRAAAYLLVNTGYDHALLLEPRLRRVSSVEDTGIKRNKDGSADLLAKASLKPLGKYTRSRSGMQIQLEKLKLDLKPNPPLLAWNLCDDLTQHSPEYRRDAQNFPLDKGAVEALKKFKGKARVNVYFGSWCPTCSRYLGRIMRLEQELDGVEIKFHYYGLPKPPAMWRDSEVRRHRIRKLPSGVVMKDGKRVGLVISSQWNKPGREVARLLLGYGK